MAARDDFLISECKKQGISATSVMGYETRRKKPHFPYSVLSTVVGGFILYVILQWNLCDKTPAKLV
jgi:hypothetical protein